jgi:dihydrofolate synthase/folylpolyglutamate synthase
MDFGGECVAVSRLQSMVETHEKLATQLSFYEFLFFLFLVLALEERSEVLVLEVGLGGRFDAVNLFDADVMGISSISRDHQEILGHQLTTILGEKWGISRPNRPLISTLEQSYLRQHLKKWSEAEGVPWSDLFIEKKVSSKMPYFLRNAQLAHALAQRLYPEHSFPEADGASIKGRFEWMTSGAQSFIFIGAHNVEGFRVMVDALTGHAGLKDASLPFDQVWIAFSKRPERDLVACLKTIEMAPCLSKKITMTTFTHPKALGLEDAKNAWKAIGPLARIEFESEWTALLSRLEGPSTILVAGSYYFIGEIQKYLVLSGASSPSSL